MVEASCQNSGMRLTEDQICLIRNVVHGVLGVRARVTLFGSRVDDTARGGDIDLLVEIDHPVDHPALSSAQIAVRISRGMHGRRVDVIIDAPNLKRQAIFQIARENGVLL